MKYSIEAAVEGELYLEAPKTVVTIDLPDVRYEFRSDDKGRVNIIAVVLTSLSGILCVGHNMRSVHAPQTENSSH